MFDSLLDTLNTNIITVGGNQINLPDHFRENYSQRGDAIIKSWLWEVPGFRRWRVTRMDAGNKLQVLNSVAYPKFDNEMPIMGIDLLWFGVKGKLVAILDFQPLIQDKNYFERYFHDLQSLKERFSEFANQKDMHSYDVNKYFSPWVIFCRGDLSHLNDKLPFVFNSFVKSYLELHNKSCQLSPEISPEEVRKLHISYDIYNSERDPAHGLFKSYFGNEWANSFVNDFLFPLMSCNTKSNTFE